MPWSSSSKAREVGGVWVYDPSVESDPRPRRPTPPRALVHVPIPTHQPPREVMGYESFPFTRVFGGDDRRFCGHAEVRAYLAAYAEHHDLAPLVRSAPGSSPLAQSSTTPPTADVERWGPRWEVISSNPTTPKTPSRRRTTPWWCATATIPNPGRPSFPAREDWPGSRRTVTICRDPEAFRGKTVVVLGAMASGEDLSREIAGVAKEVILAARGYAPNPDPTRGISRRRVTPEFHASAGVMALEREDSAVRFEDGSVRNTWTSCSTPRGTTTTSRSSEKMPVDEDAGFELEPRLRLPLHCVSAEDNAVGPLYEHVFPPSVAPSLSFVGLPWKVVPFPQFELQSRWIARALSRGCLPRATRWRRRRRRRRRRGLTRDRPSTRASHGRRAVGL